MDITESLIHYLTGWNLLVLFVTLIVCLFALLCIIINSTHRKYDHIPGPPREGFFNGNLNELRRERRNNLFFQQILLKWTLKYGHTFRLTFFHIPSVFTCDPDAVKDLLVTGHHPKAKIAYVPFISLWGQRFLGKGLVTELDQKTWAFRRALLDPCFKKGYLRNLTKEFNTGADILVRKLADMADGKTKIRLLDKFHCATLDILAKIAFGIEVNSLETENTEFNKAIHTAFKGLSESVKGGLFFTIKFEYVKLNPYNWKLISDTRKAIRILRAFGKRTLQERIDAKTKGDYIPDDILTHIIKIKEENPDIDSEVILDDFVTFFLAGQETTANLLGSLMELLGRNPEIMRRLKEEMDDIVGEKPVIEYSDLDRLVCLDMVIKETLRLASPSSMAFRQLSKDQEIDGYMVPKGTIVMMSTYVSGRLPEFFEDPEKFNPERFSPNSGNRYNTYTYFPFALGPRTCIGKHFADMEAKIIMTKLIQRFEFDFDTSKPFELEEITSIRPRGGAECVLSLRGNK